MARGPSIIERKVTRMSSISRNPDRTFRTAAIVAIATLICVVGCAARQPIVARDDASITNDVRARFAADAQASPLAVTVDTKGGLVHLTGNVPTDSDRTSVERIARDAPGVREVNNDVRFGDFTANGQPIAR